MIRMFNWLNKMLGRKPPRANDTGSEPVATTAKGQSDRTAMEIAAAFIEQNPSRTAFGVHALVRAGAAELQCYKDVIAACEKIKEHGNVDPLSPTLRRELPKEELLEFLQWHAAEEIETEEYKDENAIRELIRRFQGRR